MKILDKLKKDENILVLAVFGSYVREEKFHDIDLLLIVKEKKEYKLPVEYDVWVYTLDEFKNLVYKGYPFLLNIFIEGKAIKGKELWEKLKRIYYVLHKDKNIEVEYKGKRYSIKDLA